MVLKLQNSLEKSNFIKQLILKAICEIKINLVDFEQYKLNQQLINDVINFVKSEISKSKYSKEEFDKTEIIKEIMNQVFGTLSETELIILDSSIQFILDNKLVKKRGILKKLSWNEPCLTLLCTTSQKQTERCHPSENRPLKIREYARIQTFPDTYEFVGSITSQYKQIGNAVPVELAYSIGLSLYKSLMDAIVE